MTQLVWTPEDARGHLSPTAQLWCTSAVRAQVRAVLPLQEVAALSVVTSDTLVVVGGGTRIDAAKRWRQSVAARPRLVAVPSLWGSGAEATAIAVYTENSQKSYVVDERLRPDVRVVWPDLARDVSPSMARAACGDTWAHALEGFLSPLASEAVRASLGQVIKDMLALPLAWHPAWFELSPRAARLQESASVGLVHGIAHTLEPRIPGGSHASLCALALLPVLRFNLAASPTAARKLRDHDLDADAILGAITPLFDAAAWSALAPAIRAAWPQILRHPCTRTNVALVRPASLDALLELA